MSDTIRVVRQHDLCFSVCNAPDMDTPGARLRFAREKAGLSVADVADRIGKAASTVRAHENGQNRINASAARDYAGAVRVTASWLLYGEAPAEGEKLPIPETQRLPIRFKVAAGAWEPVDDVQDAPIGYWEAYALPAYRGVSQWLERVVGDSYNQRVPEGSLIHVIDALEIGYAPRHGDTVVVTRTRAQGAFVERTIKEVVLTPVGVELWPRSYNPRWNQPLSLTDGANGADDVEVRIVGKVVRAYQDFGGLN